MPDDAASVGVCRSPVTPTEEDRGRLDSVRDVREALGRKAGLVIVQSAGEAQVLVEVVSREQRDVPVGGFGGRVLTPPIETIIRLHLKYLEHETDIKGVGRSSWARAAKDAAERAMRWIARYDGTFGSGKVIGCSSAVCLLFWEQHIPSGPTLRSQPMEMEAKMLGQRHGIRVPKRVSRPTVTREEPLPALERSSRGTVELLELGVSHGGKIPAAGVAWRNLPVDVVHVLAYLVAHEGLHRGQIVLLARQTCHRLPIEITGGLWQWAKRAKEARGQRTDAPDV